MKRLLMALAGKIIKFEEARLEAGVYQGAEAKQAREILDIAKKVVDGKDD